MDPMMGAFGAFGTVFVIGAFVWLMAAFLVAATASELGRGGFSWFIGSVIWSPVVSLIALAALRRTSAQRAKDDLEIARLREEFAAADEVARGKKAEKAQRRAAIRGRRDPNAPPADERIEPPLSAAH